MRGGAGLEFQLRSPDPCPLTTSYETCGGNSTLWSEHYAATENDLTGVTLRVAIPTSYYPDHFLYESDGETPISGRPSLQNVTEMTIYGQYPEFLASLATKAGFSIEWSVVSEASYSAESSSWTACVLDVHKGLIDLCCGTFWNTESRLSLSTFATSYDIDSL